MRIKKAGSRDVNAAVSRLTREGAYDNATSYSPDTMYANSQMEDEIFEAIQTEAGRRLIGAQMAVPIRTQLDYQGVARKFFEIDTLKPGEIARYDRDATAFATVVAKRGEVIQYIFEGEYVEPETWEIFAPWSVRLSELNKRRFNVLDRGQEKMRIEVQVQEDTEFLALADATVAANTANNPVATSTTGVTKDFLNELTATVQVHDLPAAYLLMNFNDYKDLRGWDNTELDEVSRRELIETGIRGNIWGIDIIVSRLVTSGSVYCITEPRFFGVMPIRQDIMVMPDDVPRGARIGYVAYEEIGMSCFNSNGIAKGTVTRT
jgi:hypothetical protein